LAYKHDDVTILKIVLYDAISSDVKRCSNKHLCCYALYHCSCWGTVEVMKFLLDVGYVVDKFCNICWNFISKCEIIPMGILTCNSVITLFLAIKLNNIAVLKYLLTVVKLQEYTYY